MLALVFKNFVFKMSKKSKCLSKIREMFFELQFHSTFVIHIILILNCRNYMAKILPIRSKFQTINQCFKLKMVYLYIPGPEMKKEYY